MQALRQRGEILPGSYTRAFITRQNVVVVVLLINVVLLLFTFFLSWYYIQEVNVPYPKWTSNTTATIYLSFFWTGATSSITTLTGSSTQTVPWSEFPTTAIKDTFWTSMALIIASFCLCLVLLGMVLFLRGILTQQFGARAKWVLFALSLAMVICLFLSWFLFFGVSNNFAVDGSLCPNTAYLGISAFEDGCWCNTFLGEQTNVGTFLTNFKWGPLSGWALAIASTVVSIVASFCLFLLKEEQEKEMMQPLLGETDRKFYQ